MAFYGRLLTSGRMDSIVEFGSSSLEQIADDQSQRSLRLSNRRWSYRVVDLHAPISHMQQMTNQVQDHAFKHQPILIG